MEDQDVKGLGDYLAILKRRRWQLVVPAVLIFLIAAVAALVIPPVYRSSATILIEQQEIPSDLVRTTVTSYAAERVQVISYRVLTTAKLGDIIERFNLYPAERQKTTLAAVAQAMREEIRVETVSADVVDPRSGRSSQATIAFKLGYDHGNPVLAQKVVNELVSLFLNENLKTRRQAAADTSKFLGAEADRLATEISNLEARLAVFKERHAENLPERMQVNLQLMQHTEDQLQTNEQSLRTLEERKIFLQAGLAQLDPHTAIVSAGGQRMPTAAERLKGLELEYVGIAARYASTHPTRIRMERELAALRREAAAKKGGTDVEVTNADNPAYIQLQAQLQAADAELRAVQQEREHLKAKRAELEQRLTEAPTVEREYRALGRDYDNASAKYKELKAKQMEAELAQSLEAESKGERFALIEPPQAPTKPFKPNRLAIFFLGFVFAVGGGVGHVALRESIDSAVRGSRGVMAVMGAPPLAVIPYIVTAAETAARRRRRRLWLVAALVALVVGIGVLHFVFGPLDVLWLRALNRLELLLQGTTG